MEEKSKVKIIVVSVSVILAIVLFLIFNPFVIVGAGFRGIVLNWGAVSEKVLDVDPGDNNILWHILF